MGNRVHHLFYERISSKMGSMRRKPYVADQNKIAGQSPLFLKAHMRTILNKMRIHEKDAHLLYSVSGEVKHKRRRDGFKRYRRKRNDDVDIEMASQYEYQSETTSTEPPAEEVDTDD